MKNGTTFIVMMYFYSGEMYGFPGREYILLDFGIIRRNRGQRRALFLKRGSVKSRFGSLLLTGGCLSQKLNQGGILKII